MLDDLGNAELRRLRIYSEVVHLARILQVVNELVLLANEVLVAVLLVLFERIDLLVELPVFIDIGGVEDVLN